MTRRSIALSDELIRRALAPTTDIVAAPDLLEAVLTDVAVTRPRRRIVAWPWTPEVPGQPWRSTTAGRVAWAGIVVALLAVAVLGVLAALAQLNQPPGPLGGRILMYSDHGALFAVAPDGSDPFLVPDLDPWGNPAWAPDGSRFVIAAMADERLHLEIRGSSGQVEALLRLPARSGTIGIANWSRDGSRIVVTVSVRGINRMLVYEVDDLDAEPVDVTPTGVAVERSLLPSAWSPDGRSLTFVAQDLRSGAEALWIADVATGSTRVVVAAADGFDVGFGNGESVAAWSPAGSLIAFEAHDLYGTAIFVVQPDGHGLRRIAPEFALTASPQWSPDGARLLFENRRTGRETGSEAWAIGADGSDLVLVMPDGNPRGWSPDGWVLGLSPTCASGDNYGAAALCRQDLFLVPSAGVASLDDPRVRRLLSADQIDGLLGPNRTGLLQELSWPGMIPVGDAPDD
jgi:Tol biopolymer transport system component